jgi:hypothetical protein
MRSGAGSAAEAMMACGIARHGSRQSSRHLGQSPAGHCVEAALLGMPVRIACPSAADAAAVRQACVAWVGACDGFAPPLVITLGRGARSAVPDSSAIDVAGARMTISGTGIEAVADAAHRSAAATLSPQLLASPAALLAHVLEPLGLFLATRNGRVPIHASGVQLDDLAVLFSGPSGAGKSSLALAASRAGLPVMSEDTIYVQREPQLAIWGWQGPIHLLARDAGAAAGPLRLRNGRVKRAIEFPGMRRTGKPLAATTLCILRHGERASLTPISQACALASLGPLERGFDLLAVDIEAALSLLTRNGAWWLTLSGSPDEAIALVRQQAESLRRRAAGR